MASSSDAPLDLDLTELKDKNLRRMSSDEFRALGTQLLSLYERDRQENQLRYYQPVSDDARKIHEATERVIGVGGGNGSSKTETCIVEMLACGSGTIPDSLNVPEKLEDGSPNPRFIDWRRKFKGPRKQRIVVESLTNTLHSVILPKLKWWVWTGIGMPGSSQGHWGWVPHWSLINGQWEKSWSEKLRTLRYLCRDPDQPDKVMGESTIQFLSHDNDPEDFASGDYDDILHDEPPRQAIYVENEARTMRADGRLLLAMTWPDDPAIPVDWLHEIYEAGQGPNKLDDTIWLNLFTTDNKNLNQEAVAAQAAKWDEQTRQVRIYGKSIRFSNRIHPLFTNQESWWCFDCGKEAFPKYENGDATCVKCGSESLTTYNHVEAIEPRHTWPVVYLLDPHPRKDHMMLWVAITPSGDWWVRKELSSGGACEDVALQVRDIEETMGFRVARRLIDPNMGRSPSNADRREQTWQDAFWDAGLSCDLADDSGVGRKVVNTMLRPDPHTLAPRLLIHPECKEAIHQINRYSWDDYKRDDKRDQKQTPRAKFDDFPTLLKYLGNADPDFGNLNLGDPIITRRRANVDARQHVGGRR